MLLRGKLDTAVLWCSVAMEGSHVGGLCDARFSLFGSKGLGTEVPFPLQGTPMFSHLYTGAERIVTRFRDRFSALEHYFNGLTLHSRPQFHHL